MKKTPMELRPRRLLAALVTTTAVTAVIASGPASASTGPAAAVVAPAPTAPVRDDGPHAAPNRPRAATTTTRRNGVVVREVDLGNADIGRKRGAFVTPVRGLLVTPDKPAANAPLVIVAHLRYAGCEGRVYAYPCPGGKELRLDRGMTYLGEALARQGYSVLIPDLAPLYVSTSLTYDYDQYAGFRTVVGRLRDEAVKASAGKPTAFGKGLEGAVDARRTGLVAHSRSGMIAGSAVAAWAKTATPIVSVLGYGPVYEAPDPDGKYTPMVPDVPYLAALGDRDEDVSFLPGMWLTEHIGSTRANPAALAVVPGLGHSWINRELSSRGLDDRLGCTPATCPGAGAHEVFLSRTAIDWFGATVRKQPTMLPLRPTSPLPEALGDLPARWLAATNGKRTNLFLGGVRGSFSLLGKGSTLRVCRYADPMNPEQPENACPEVEAGIPQSTSTVAQVRVTPRAGVSLRADQAGAQELVLQVSPPGDRSDRRPGSPLRVTVHAAGRTHVVDVPATHPALRDRRTKEAEGTYLAGTVRIPLPAWVTAGTVTAVDLTGGSATSTLDVRAVDLVVR